MSGRCPVCREVKCICKGTAPWSGTAIGTEPLTLERIAPMAGKLVKVRTGPSSYLKMTEKEAAEYRKNTGEWSGDDRVDLAEEQANQDAGATKAESAPAENKARSAPAEKKAR